MEPFSGLDDPYPLNVDKAPCSVYLSADCKMLFSGASPSAQLNDWVIDEPRAGGNRQLDIAFMQDIKLSIAFLSTKGMTGGMVTVKYEYSVLL